MPNYPLITKLSAFILLMIAAPLTSFVADDPQKPDNSRFTPVVVASDLDEPEQFAVTNSGRVFIVERKGALKVYDPITKTVKLVATIPVNNKYTAADGKISEAEEGLFGVTIDPNFDTNHWIYLLSAPATESIHALTRWEVVNDKLVSGSDKRLLTIKEQRETCCHTGGGMTWDAKGNLFITVGNNTGNTLSAHTDERPNRVNWDDQGHSSNTNDLRGKILRIHPEPNGTYSIPDGNLFPKGTANTRPEIYTMGHRNAWRVSVDSKTGFIYWGEVGPDASLDSELGPRGYDELNQARKPGYFGWPYFVGPNAAFPYWDYVTNKPLDKKDPNKPINNSVNNTGLKELPPVAPPFIYYPYAYSEQFPLVGTGGRSATGGPIYHRSDFKNPKRPWPAYFEGKWIVTDLERGWIMVISMYDNGDYKSMEQIIPDYKPVEPIDIKFGPDGDLYMLEYGSSWFKKSTDSKLVRIEYNSGNRKPVVAVSADKTGGTVPFKITLSSEGTKDFDGDALKYQWKVTSPGTPAQLFTTKNPTVSFNKTGVYNATLIVTDPKGSSNSKSLKIIAGNEPPAVAFNVTGNKTFFFPGKPIIYSVSVADKEDGNLADGKINPSHVAVSIDYTSEGFDYAEVRQAQRSVDASTQYAVAQALISKSDCKNCHNVSGTKSIGPLFTQIADKYKNDPSQIARLAKKIQEGGSGVWGDVTMPAHPGVTTNNANLILRYIMSISDKTINTLPVSGNYTAEIPAGDNGKGSYILRAAYTDKGAKSIPAQTSENTLILRNPLVAAFDADVKVGTTLKVEGNGTGPFNILPKNNSYIGFKKLDMTGIKQLELLATATTRDGASGGIIEIRLGSVTGELIGQTEVFLPGQGPVSTAPRQRGLVTLKVDVKPTSGFQDIYFVFKNDKAKGVQPLMAVTNIKFNQERVN
ncbi:MAG TPA: PKD domain-containing protein [Sphingobacteriaceae bacterium]|nr:PKD domain-containing protein [Sphingobacteriaceae bacterium]